MSWTLDFLREWSPRITLASAWRLRGVTLRFDRPDLGRKVQLRMKQPWVTDVMLREGTTDFGTWNEVWLDQVYSSVPRCLNGCRTIVDLGANTGLATLYFASAFPGANVFSVEPHPENYAILRQNIRQLGNRCRTLQAAVWNNDGKLAQSGSSPAYGHDAFRFREDASNPHNATIEALSMQTIFERSGFDRIDLLKVDIEGAEVQLLQGAGDWLTKVNAIAIEFHGNSRAESGFDQLTQGFRIADESPHTVLAIRDAS